MKIAVSAILAAIIVGGTYFATFGAPAAILSLLPQERSEPVQASGIPQDAPMERSRPRERRGGSDATIVVTQALETAPYERNLRAIGSAVAARSVEVTADVSGTITEVNASPNDLVEVGQILFQLDDETERLNVEIAQAERDQASQALQRYRSLVNSSAVSAVDLADAEVTVRLAEAELSLAKVALEERAVRAAIAGQVGLSPLDIGDRVNEGDVLVSIDALEELLIEFELPERAIGLLAVGRAIRTNTPVYAGEVFNGRIVAHDSRLDSVTRSVTVQALIDNSDRRLWSGMTFSVRLEDQTDPLPVVPATAITWTSDGAGIWSVKNGKASRVPITILYRQGNSVWLEADLGTDVRVVTEGAQKLREGAAVRSAGGGDAEPADQAPLIGAPQYPAAASDSQIDANSRNLPKGSNAASIRTEADPA